MPTLFIPQLDKRAIRAGTAYRQERTHVRPHLIAYCRHVSAGHDTAARCRHGDDMSWSRVCHPRDFVSMSATCCYNVSPPWYADTVPSDAVVQDYIVAGTCCNHVFITSAFVFQGQKLIKNSKLRSTRVNFVHTYVYNQKLIKNNTRVVTSKEKKEKVHMDEVSWAISLKETEDKPKPALCLE